MGREAVNLATKVAPGVEADCVTPEGNPAEKLLDLADQHEGSLLVVGSQGMNRSVRFLLGGVPHKISHHAVGDVLVVRTGEGRPDRLPERILAGYDGSVRAGRALRRAVALANASGAQLIVLTVHDDEAAGRVALERAVELAGAAGADISTECRDGDPADGLLDAAADVDLVVVGNRGMTGVQRFVLGGVPNKVSHHIDRDLLIVKTNE